MKMGKFYVKARLIQFSIFNPSQQLADNIYDGTVLGIFHLY